jgi:hypothetical protein
MQQSDHPKFKAVPRLRIVQICELKETSGMQKPVTSPVPIFIAVIAQVENHIGTPPSQRLCKVSEAPACTGVKKPT